MVTAETVRRVFALEAHVIADPLTGTPLVLPVPTRRGEVAQDDDGQSAGRMVVMSDLGGDSACWLDRVCEECGGFMADDGPHTCRPSTPAPRPPTD